MESDALIGPMETRLKSLVDPKMGLKWLDFFKKVQKTSTFGLNSAKEQRIKVKDGRYSIFTVHML